MKGLSRGWTIVIVASLSMNLFILGFIAASGVRAAQVPATLLVKTAPEPAAPPLAKPPAAPQLQRIAQINSKTLRPSQIAVRKANEAVTSALMAEPYDAQRLRKALEDLRVATLNSQHAVHDVMIEAVMSMSPQQRAEFAEASKRAPAERVLLVGR